MNTLSYALSFERLIYTVPAILIAMTLHEMAHGFVSYKLGDPTPKEDGRLSLNPFRHLDPLGALCMLLFGFGWAKPVMVDSRSVSYTHLTEEVMIQRPESHKTYFKAKLERVHHKSKDRVQPACRIAHRCKVCSIMHLQYEKQLKAKTDILKQTLSKYAGIDGKCVQPMIANASPIGYRNPVSYTHLQDRNNDET